MKKIITVLLAAVMLFSLASCKPDSISEEFISDGLFKYYYIKKSDCYALVGNNQKTMPDPLYLPAYYKGKEVRGIYCRETLRFHDIYYNIELNGVNRVYFPYACDLDLGLVNGLGHLGITVPDEAFFVYENEVDDLYQWIRSPKSDYRICFLTKTLYEEYVNKYDDMYREGKIGEYITSFYDNYSKLKYKVQIANTSYLFNYEDAPNGGYFFTNDFERGGKIENAPYEPLRNGYTFGGWYKEAECENKWDFETDKLPDAEYDENNILKFVETCLYAKWIKN